MNGPHVLDIAAEILQEQNTPMHINLIAVEAQSKNLIHGMSFEVFVKKVGAALAANLKTRNPRFAKVESKKNGSYKKGVYRLIKRRAVSTFPSQEPIQTNDTGYLGRAGEMAVMSELLFRNFNVSMMMVDKGIDIIAANEDGKYFHVQVKTTSSSDGNYNFSIKRKAFDFNNSGQTFYIFVMRNPSKTDFLILPNPILVSYIANDIVRGSETLSIRINYDKLSKKYILNTKIDVSIHVNKFAQIN
jgi:hypothetical protein